MDTLLYEQAFLSGRILIYALALIHLKDECLTVALLYLPSHNGKVLLLTILAFAVRRFPLLRSAPNRQNEHYNSLFGRADIDGRRCNYYRLATIDDSLPIREWVLTGHLQAWRRLYLRVGPFIRLDNQTSLNAMSSSRGSFVILARYRKPNQCCHAAGPRISVPCCVCRRRDFDCEHDIAADSLLPFVSLPKSALSLQKLTREPDTSL